MMSFKGVSAAVLLATARFGVQSSEAAQAGTISGANSVAAIPSDTSASVVQDRTEQKNDLNYLNRGASAEMWAGLAITVGIGICAWRSLRRSSR
jgi:hypothetical protein